MRRLLFAAAPAMALAVSLYAVDLPLFAMRPGPAREVVPRIDVDGRRTYQPRGRLLLTTVNVGRVNLFDALRVWRDPTVNLVPEEEVLRRGETEREHRRQSRSEMDESKIAAVAAALRRLTGYPEERGEGMLVQNVLDGTPAAGALAPGDVILSVDGRGAESAEEVSAAIRRAGAGRVVRLLVRDGRRRRTVEVRPVAHPATRRPVIGVVLVEAFPFGVRIESGDVGGPSAGLMWALGLVDLLTPGELTSGRTVAGTGSIDIEGAVHAVGGIEHKVPAAERAGAEVFLLPRDNLDEARAVRDEIRLVPVDDIDEALRYLDGSA